MAKRILYFGNPTKLSIKNFQLSIEVVGGSATEIHVEDISTIILDHQQITWICGQVAIFLNRLIK